MSYAYAVHWIDQQTKATFKPMASTRHQLKVAIFCFDAFMQSVAAYRFIHSKGKSVATFID